ncbi:MAG: tetratricopeptide repeat protein [Burkholderiales bacterium]|nr:tetratricopeptide repeat protein [Burkholderiales bacterium]
MTAPARRWTMLAVALAGSAAVLAGYARYAGPGGVTGPERGARIVPASVDPDAHARTSRRAEVDARFGQAVVMLHARRHDLAIAALHRVIELEPRMPEAHVNMGYAQLGAGEPRIARDFFDGAIALRPAQANAWYGLALASDALGDRPRAIGAMRTFLHLADGSDGHRRRAMSALWEWQAAAGRPEPESPLPAVGARPGTAALRTDAFGFPCFGTPGFDCRIPSPRAPGAVARRPQASGLLDPRILDPRTGEEGGSGREPR